MKPHKCIISVLSILLVLTFFTGCGDPDEPGISEIDWNDKNIRSEQFVTALVNGDYTIASSGFDATMTRSLSVRRLAKAWTDTVKVAGAFDSIVSTEEVPNDEYDIYIVLTRHENMGINTRIVFTEDNQVAGLFFTFVQDIDG